jgi:hypothetical protein
LGHPLRSNIDIVNSLLRDRHHTLLQLEANLLRAQDRMKKFADTHHTECKFDVGDWVYLRLCPYRRISLSHSTYPKLSPYFYEPFEIEERVSTVVYHLRLPVGTDIHPVLHVSQLNRHLSRDQVISPYLSITSPEGQLHIYPHKILDRRVVKRNNIAVPQILLSWTNLPPEDAFWEDYDAIASQFSVIYS